MISIRFWRAHPSASWPASHNQVAVTGKRRRAFGSFISQHRSANQYRKAQFDRTYAARNGAGGSRTRDEFSRPYRVGVLVELAAFTAAATLIVLLPGPDTMVVVRNLVRGGKSLAVRTVLGVLTGLSIWVITAALGLSAVLRASSHAYLGLRIAGACYLVVLGIRSLRSRGEQNSEEASSARRMRSGYPSGLLTDLMNPKVGVFFVTFLPGFVPHGYPVGLTSLLLGTIFVILTGLYFMLLLTASKPILRWLSTTHLRRRLDRCTGAVLIGFGLRLALEP